MRFITFYTQSLCRFIQIKPPEGAAKLQENSAKNAQLQKYGPVFFQQKLAKPWE